MNICDSPQLMHTGTLHSHLFLRQCVLFLCATETLPRESTKKNKRSVAALFGPCAFTQHTVTACGLLPALRGKGRNRSYLK